MHNCVEEAQRVKMSLTNSDTEVKRSYATAVATVPPAGSAAHSAPGSNVRHNQPVATRRHQPNNRDYYRPPPHQRQQYQAHQRQTQCQSYQS